jgi:hypothetical protein
MLRIAGYIDRAHAAELEAERVSTPSTREALLSIARAWRKLADTMVAAIQAEDTHPTQDVDPA